MKNQIKDKAEFDFMEKLLNTLVDLKLIKPINEDIHYAEEISVSLSVTRRCNLNVYLLFLLCGGSKR